MDITLPYTERPNGLTENIDKIGNARGVVRLLKAVDAQLFGGYAGEHPGLSDLETAKTLDLLTVVASEMILNAKDSVIVISGAGTSGRIAFAVAREMNLQLVRQGKRACIKYLIAGKSKALIESQELAEDDPRQAVEDLKEAVVNPSSGKPFGRVLFIGISCGLSATYVGAQLSFAMSQHNYAAAVIGFSPPEMARRISLSGWDSSFADTWLGCEEWEQVAARMNQKAETSWSSTACKYSGQSAMLESQKATASASEQLKSISESRVKSEKKTFFNYFTGVGRPATPSSPVTASPAATQAPSTFVITPVVGPEAITGSTRLKSGTATKFILEVVLGRAVAEVLDVPFLGMSSGDSLQKQSKEKAKSGTDDKMVPFNRVLREYENAVASSYRPLPEIAQVAESARMCLERSGHVIYVGSGEAGIAGIIDASEQVPTFGSQPGDFQGYIVGGWESFSKGTLPIKEPEEEGDAAENPLKKIGTDRLLQTVLPNATASDLVVVLDIGEGVPSEVSDMISEVHSKRGVQVAVITVKREVSSSMSDNTSNTDDDGEIDGEGAVLIDSKSNGGTVLDLEALYKLQCQPSVMVVPVIQESCAHPLLPSVEGLLSISLKLVLNTISTTSQVLLGKVHGCRMVDLRLSNDKLIRRAITLVKEIARVEEVVAKQAIIRAIHHTKLDAGEATVEEMGRLESAEHVKIATSQRRIVPTAVLLALGKCETVADAKKILRKQALASVLDST